MQISSQLRGQSWQSQVSKTQWDPSAIDRFVDSPSAHVSEARRESISIPSPPNINTMTAISTATHPVPMNAISFTRRSCCDLYPANESSVYSPSTHSAAHDALMCLLRDRAINSSNLESKSFRMGDLFDFL